MTAAADSTHVSVSAARRAEILDHLRRCPGQTAGELAVRLGYRLPSGKPAANIVLKLLTQMQGSGQVVSAGSGRMRGGNPVRIWKPAPPGTPAPGRSLLTPERLQRKRERERRQKRRARDRARGRLYVPPAAWTLPATAACKGADLRLFFPEAGQDDSAAKAICARCPIRARCLQVALRNGERHGVWGGVNLETERAALRSVTR